MSYADPTPYDPDPPPPEIGARLAEVSYDDMLTEDGRTRVLHIIGETLEDIEQLRRELHGASMQADAAHKKHTTLMHKIEQLVF